MNQEGRLSPISPDGFWQWNGFEWVPNPYRKPARKGRGLRVALGGVGVLVAVLIVSSLASGPQTGAAGESASSRADGAKAKNTEATNEEKAEAKKVAAAREKFDTRFKAEGWSYSDESETVAYRWLKSSEFQCSFGDRCWGMLVWTSTGCPAGVYAEVGVENANGVVLGFANDISGALPAGKSAALVLETMEPGAAHGSLTRINCY